MPKKLTIEKGAEGSLRLLGELDLYHANKARRLFQKALKRQQGVTLDLSGLSKLDTAGALLLRQIQSTYSLRLQRLKPEHAAILGLVADTDVTLLEPARLRPAAVRALILIGKNTVHSYKGAKELIAFFGQVCVTLMKSFSPRGRFRLADTMHHIEETGIHAIPIISTMAFMIAVVLAYQGVAQLRPLGAQHLTINLVSISVLREMGVLLTSIMVAGRSGSAFTAEIGVMKVREEIDALKTIGIDPFEVLVIPRLLALVITLPLLTFIANMMGLLGGGVMSMLLINVPFESYVHRVQHVASGKDLFVGMIKAPVFGLLIAMVGCMHGMRVSGSAESVGTETTASVVKSIFLVLMADALFSVIFQKMGI